MIKVGISGCEGLCGAELVRLLINHPDVELMWVSAANHAGVRLDHIVPGIVGECDMTVCAHGSLDEVELLYLCGNRETVAAQMRPDCWRDDLKVIDLSGSHNTDLGEDKPWVYGLSEMQRRILVHETRWATVPGAAAVASMLALLPLARNQMLTGAVTLHVQAGAAVFTDDGKTIDGLDAEAYSLEQQQELCLALRQCQPSLPQPVTLAVSPTGDRRTITVDARFKSDVNLSMLNNLYEQYYGDHNFVFVMDRPTGPADVENTNKYLVCLEKDDNTGEVRVHGTMDALLKGGAGTAVHMMNLMFGLHERVGLSLKATGC